MKEKITEVLENHVNPILAGHYGGAVFSSFDDDGVLWVKLTGECATCPSALDTIEDVVKSIVMQKIPEVRDVRLDDGLSDEMLEFARKLLSENK